MIINQGKSFELPPTDFYLGTIADVVDLGISDKGFGLKARLRIVWILDKPDSEGKPFQVIWQGPANTHEKSKLYPILTGILGAPPTPTFETDEILGKSNKLCVVYGKGADGKFFSKVTDAVPVPAGAVAPKVPADYVRFKDRPAKPVQAPLNNPAPTPATPPVNLAPPTAAAPTTTNAAF